MQDAPESGGESGGESGPLGLDGLMDNLFRELAPELDKLGQDMSGALSGMGPVLQNLATLGQDLENYQAPERLENGDILIRRKPGAPPPPPLGEGLREYSSPDDPSADPDRFDKIPDVIPLDPDAPEYEL